MSDPNLTFQPPLNPLLPKEGKPRATVIFEAEVAEKAGETAEMLSVGRIVAVPAVAGTFEKYTLNTKASHHDGHSVIVFKLSYSECIFQKFRRNGNDPRPHELISFLFSGPA